MTLKWLELYTLITPLNYCLTKIIFLLHFTKRFGIDKIKLQHEAGNPTLIASCAYNHPSICQHPLLHDMEITSSVVSGKFGASDQMTSVSNIALKNMAQTQSATLRLYKSRRSNSVCIANCNRYRSRQTRRVRKLNPRYKESYYMRYQLLTLK